MKKVPATEAKQRFGELLDNVQREPLAITKQGRTVALMVPAHEPEVIEALAQAMEDAYWGSRARASAREGHMGGDASAALIKDVLDE